MSGEPSAATPPSTNVELGDPLGVDPIVWMLVAGGLLAAVLVLRWLWRVRQERGSTHSAGEVVGVIGRPGSGKTLFAVRLARDRLAMGAQVRTNFTMTLPDELAANWGPFTGWDDLIELQDAIVILDEAHLIAPSTVGAGAGQTLPQEARWYLSQVRRMGVQLYWISQHEMRVTKTLRDLTNYIWVCNSFRGGRSFKATQYEPERLRREGQHLEIRRWRWDPTLAELFDTWEILQTGSTATEADRRIAELANARNRKRGLLGKVGEESARQVDRQFDGRGRVGGVGEVPLEPEREPAAQAERAPAPHRKPPGASARTHRMPPNQWRTQDRATEGAENAR